MAVRTSQSFTKQYDAHKLTDFFSIEKKTKYTVDISNIRYENGRIVANVTDACEMRTCVNKADLSTSNGSGNTEQKDITSAFNNVDEFKKAFYSIPASNTSVEIIVNIHELPDDAPQGIKNFCNAKLSEQALQDLLKAVEQELTTRKQNAKVEGKLKLSLIRDVFKYLDDSTDILKAVKIALLGSAFSLGGMLYSSSIALALNINAPIILAIATLGLIATPFYAINLAMNYRRKKAETLSKTGELDNESIETPENKKKLVTKLLDLMDDENQIKIAIPFSDDKNKKIARENACSAAIELGQQSYNSYFVRLKSFFMPTAYHEGYYVGQEMAAKRSLKK